MIQCGGRLSFLYETLHAMALRSDVRGQNLQRHFSIQFCVLREIHLTHPTGAKLGHDAVVRKSCREFQFFHQFWPTFEQLSQHVLASGRQQVRLSSAGKDHFCGIAKGSTPD
jgi:hypothetical protein